MAKPFGDDHNQDRSASLSAVLTARGEVCFTYFVRNVDDPENIYVYFGGRRDENRDRW